MGHVLQHGGMLRDTLEECYGKRREEEDGQLVDLLGGKKNYLDLKKAAEDNRSA